MNARCVVVVAILIGFTSAASAHAFLERASPSAGQNLSASPPRVEMHFSEALEPSFSEVKVTDVHGRDMAGGPPVASGTEMDLPLKKLPPGRYRVSWRAVSVDTHHTEGKYNFLILP
jgi:methionine-rich copper-binding protein CopC